MACTPQELMDAARCFLCLSPGQLQMVRIRLLCAIKDGETVSCDPQTLLEAAKCLGCLTEGQLEMVEVYLLCQIVSAGGTGGGGGGATCGTTDPVAAPTGSCGIYYQLASGTTPSSLWIWDSGLAAWVKVLS